MSLIYCETATSRKAWPRLQFQPHKRIAVNSEIRGELSVEQRPDRRFCTSLAAVALLVCACCHLYAAPANDNFANATVLSGNLPLTDSTTNILSPAEAGEPGHAGSAA